MQSFSNMTMAIMMVKMIKMMMVTLAAYSLKHDKDFDGNYDDHDNDDYISSVLAHAVLLKHDQGLQSTSHKGIQVFSMSPDIYEECEYE